LLQTYHELTQSGLPAPEEYFDAAAECLAGARAALAELPEPTPDQQVALVTMEAQLALARGLSPGELGPLRNGLLEALRLEPQVVQSDVSTNLAVTASDLEARLGTANRVRIAGLLAGIARLHAGGTPVGVTLRGGRHQ
jgi:hypothetical protein